MLQWQSAIKRSLDSGLNWFANACKFDKWSREPTTEIKVNKNVLQLLAILGLCNL